MPLSWRCRTLFWQPHSPLLKDRATPSLGLQTAESTTFNFGHMTLAKHWQPAGEDVTLCCIVVEFSRPVSEQDCGRQALQSKRCMCWARQGSSTYCGKMWMAVLNNSEGWQGSETYYSGISRNCIWSIWYRIVGSGDIIHWSIVGQRAWH